MTRATALPFVFASLLAAFSLTLSAQAPTKKPAADPKADAKAKVAPPAAAPATAQGLTPEIISRIKAATVYIVANDGRKGASGSGFVVKNDGETTYIVTNDHVVNFEHDAMAKGAEATGRSKMNVEVIFRSGTTPVPDKYTATILAADPKRDLAVIKVSRVKEPPEPIDLGDHPKLIELMPLTISGFGLGGSTALEGQLPKCALTTTSISSVQDNLRTGRVARIQVNGGMSHGNSGGPVLSSADGRLVGVASSGFDGTQVAFVIPRDEVMNVLAGTHGRIRIVADKADAVGDGPAKLRVAIIDPMKTVKTVTAHYRKVVPVMPATEGKHAIMPDAKKVDLAMEGAFAVGEIVAPSRGKIVVQIELQLASGAVVSFPEDVAISSTAGGGGMGGTMPVPNNPEMVETTDNRRFRARTADGRAVDLPSRPFRSKPKNSEGTTDLGDLNRRPGEFLDKSISVECLWDGQMKSASDGSYELKVFTEAGNLPGKLLMRLPKDLGLQLSEVYQFDPPIVSYALRLEGKIAKPTGRGDVHPFEVTEIHFLNEESKPVTTLKPAASPPPGTTNLSLVNRFPAEFKGKTVTIEAHLDGIDNSQRQIAFRVNHEACTPVLNLKFFAAKGLADQVQTDVPNGGSLVRLECVVESIDPRSGHGILGVTSIETLDAEKKPKKKLTSKDSIEYPKPASVPVKSAATDKAAPAAKPESEVSSRRQPATATTEAPSEGSNLPLMLGISGGIGAIALAIGGFLYYRGGSKAKPVNKYQRKSESKAAPPPEAAKPAPRPAPTAAVPAPKPKSSSRCDDNPFANFG